MGFFAWEAAWGIILTFDMLKRYERVLANRCFLCEEEETVDHLLLRYSKAIQLWDLLLAIVGVNWVFLLTVREALLSWSRSFVGKNVKKSLDGNPPRDLLDNLAGKEQHCVLQQSFFSRKVEIFFSL